MADLVIKILEGYVYPAKKNPGSRISEPWLTDSSLQSSGCRAKNCGVDVSVQAGAEIKRPSVFTGFENPGSSLSGKVYIATSSPTV